MTAVVTGTVDPLVLRSPDRLVRLGLTLCTAALATGPLLAAAVVTRGSVVLAMIVLLLAGTAVVGARIAQEGCTVDADGLTDRRTFRSRSYRWEDVAAVAVDRTRRSSRAVRVGPPPPRAGGRRAGHVAAGGPARGTPARRRRRGHRASARRGVHPTGHLTVRSGRAPTGGR